MHMKFVAACVAATALIAAPAASGSPVLTDGAGVKVAAGTTLKGTNVGNLIFTGGFNVVCTSAVGTGTVTENSGTSVKGEIPAGSVTLTGTDTSGDCTSAFGPIKASVQSKTCLATVPKSADQMEVSGCGSNVTFTLAVTGGFSCKYELAKVLGTFNTAPNDLVVTVGEQEAKGEVGNPFLCPSGGKLDASLALTTNSGGTLVAS